MAQACTLLLSASPATNIKDWGECCLLYSSIHQHRAGDCRESHHRTGDGAWSGQKAGQKQLLQLCNSLLVRCRQRWSSVNIGNERFTSPKLYPEGKGKSWIMSCSPDLKKCRAVRARLQKYFVGFAETWYPKQYHIKVELIINFFLLLDIGGFPYKYCSCYFSFFML